MGIRTQFIKLKTKVIKGAITNKILFELLGNKTSFTKSLKPSDSGCNKPKNPIAFGPRRR